MDHNQTPQGKYSLPPSPSGLFAERYQILRLLGEGGMATVFLARDLHAREKPVALKVLHQELSTDETVRARFFREIEILRRIAHPNIVDVLDSGEWNYRLYFTLEYVHGCSLEDFLESGVTLPPPELAVILLGICDGLSALHQKNIVHRDLKPGNVLVTPDGLVKLIDLGVAHEANSNLTKRYQRVGSMLYMAPEVWLGKGVGPASDLYSLGVMLYELVLGHVPFDHEYPGEIMKMHLEARPTPPREQRTGVPVWLDGLIMRLLEKDPARRSANAEEVCHYLTSKAHLHLISSSHRTKEQSFLADTTKKILEKRKHVSGHDQARELVRPTKKGTYTLRLNATTKDEEESKSKRRKTSVTIALPKKFAVTVELEPPSLDFFFLGLFLASLQIFDGVLTSMGVERFGTQAEGNSLLFHLMEHFGPDKALIIVKLVAIASVAALTFAARQFKWVSNMIAFLSCVYLVAAILPWLYILSSSSAFAAP